MPGLPTPYQTVSDRRDQSFPSEGTYQEPSCSGRFAFPSQRSTDPPVSSNPGHSRRHQSPFSPHVYLQEPRHSTPAERTHVSTPSCQTYDRTTSQQDEPFHSTPARRTHMSTPPRQSHERRQKPQDQLTPVGSYHPILREDSRGTPEGSDRSLETSYLSYMMPENRSGIYKSSVADNTNYEIELTDPSPQRLTSEVRDLNRSQHQQEAKNDEMKKIQREMHEKSLSQNKQLSNSIKKLTERVLALEAEKREADNIRMNLMSGMISGLEERLTDAENKFQEFESALEDQNQKNVERVQGLLAHMEDLKTRNREHEIRYEFLKQTLAKLQEVLIKSFNELLRRQSLAQKEQEKYNRELQESMNELLQNQGEWERLRSDLQQMEQSVDKLDKSLTEMRTIIKGVEDKNEQNNETLRSKQENLEQSVQELKELVPAVSDKQEEGDADDEGEDKKEKLTKKETEDRKPAAEFKETVGEPARSTQDLKTKEKGEVEEKKEVKKEQETRKEKKETPAPTSVRAKGEDVATKGQEVKPPPVEGEDKAKPVKVPGRVESKEKVEVSSKPSEDVKTKKKDEMKEAGKVEDSLKKKKEGETEEKKETPHVSPEKAKEEAVKEKDTASPSTKAEDKIKQKEIPRKVDSEKTDDEPSKPKEDVTTKEKDEVTETGKDEETLEEKTKGEKKETPPVLPEQVKLEDDKQKEIVPPSAKDQSKGDEKPSKPAGEEVANEEEKEADSSREIRFSAPADLSYADEKNDWQLRGKGQFQILFDKDDKNYLLEMRRDEDNSLCAKHPITKAIQLMPMRGQDRSYAWSAMDFSDKEGSPVSMTFAVRFKNRETADNFQEEFQKAQTPEPQPPPAGKGKDKEKKKKEPKKDKDKKGDHSLHPSDPSLHSSKVSLTPSQASSQPGDVLQSPKSPKSPKDEEEKKPEKKKKKGFLKRVKDKVTGLLEGSDESDGGDGESSSASSSSESSSDDEKEK
ncbi:RANBP2-like and GRIP domain-containing protein 2 [Holothuria leucospilota]|uniref:RANBP2-like and GRIP domain-containing protein 2 n=1 Tax=Holothuria leucospilota TaxID=206669 RepID=A0A9Q1H093_HOLLE|nr:RANBP2-like and GRIP domain-containing protein 2 [Holothuria leucospilota]